MSFKKINDKISDNKENPIMLIALAICILLVYAMFFMVGIYSGLELSVIMSNISTIPDDICLLLGAFLASIIFRLLIMILKIFKMEVKVKNSIMINMFFWMYVFNIFANKI